MLLNEQVKLVAAGVLISTLLACAPVIDNRGFVFDENALTTLQKGASTMDSVRDTFGSPSTITSLNNNAYYYIQARFVTESYRAPQEVERKVLAIYFAPDRKLRDFAVYGLEDGIIIPIVERTTATQGQELSFIAQAFGNLGRFSDGAPSSDF